jgi:hypothetical protein
MKRWEIINFSWLYEPPARAVVQAGRNHPDAPVTRQHHDRLLLTQDRSHFGHQRSRLQLQTRRLALRICLIHALLDELFVFSEDEARVYSSF